MRTGGAILCVLLLGLLAAAPSWAEDPPLVNWPAFLPAVAVGFTPSTFDVCPDGSPRCLDHTLREIDRRLVTHDAACSDNALFLRNYGLVTRFYQRLAGTGFFADDAYVAREDAIFAQLYFDAEDNWAAGRRDRVPEAWRIAFDAADRKAVQGAGNLLLGINAHVQRDQPYMIAGLGLVDERGRSRKADHDKFNELLNTAYDDVFAQAIAEDDPDLAMYDAPGTQGDNFLAFQTIAAWREGVWRNAERLVRAKTDAERRLVAESIERNAAEWARRIRDTFGYGGPFTRAKRDALCARRAERARRAAAEQHRLEAGKNGGGGCRVRPTVRAVNRRIRIGPRCLRVMDVSIAKRTARGRCRFVGRRGRLGRARPCSRRLTFRRRMPLRTARLPRGRYVVRLDSAPRRIVRVR